MILSELIRQAEKHNGVITAYVYGEMGVGKTSYSLWIAYKLLGDWNRALEHVFFHPEEALLAMKKVLSRGARLPVIIMDDAGTWLDRMTWWEEYKVSFMKFFNLVRTVASGVIFTTPTEEIPRQIVRKCFIRVNVRRTSNEELLSILGVDGLNKLIEETKNEGVSQIFSLAVGYAIKTLPSFIQLVKKEFYDVFPLHYPDHIYRVYEERRRKAVKQLLDSWEEELKGSLLEKAASIYHRSGKNEAVKFLKSKGVPLTTAYRWISKLSEE